MTGGYYWATPRVGTVRDVYGDPCRRAAKYSYPLRARCDLCGADIVALDGTAAWMHHRTRRGPCEPKEMT